MLNLVEFEVSPEEKKIWQEMEEQKKRGLQAVADVFGIPSSFLLTTSHPPAGKLVKKTHPGGEHGV